MNDIIVGVDRSETARAAATRAAEIAGALDCNLHVVMCAERTKSGDVKVGGETFHVDWLSDAEQYLADLARGLHHEPVTTAVGEGDPAKMLCDEAEERDAGMIVVGNRRVQGMSRVLGSVAAAVLRGARCDVLIVHTTG